MYQVLVQHQLFGFWFFGEPVLNQSPEIAKGSQLFGVFGGNAVQILPYGTTPHPNILAGVFVFALGVLSVVGISTPMLLIACSATLLVIAMTQSMTALLALVFGIAVWIYVVRNKSHKETKIAHSARLSVVVFCVITVVLLVVPTVIKNLSSNISRTLTEDSIVRRAKLENIALEMFQTFPVNGVGLNRFPVEMDRFGIVGSTTRFLQPVHNIPLLLLAESGVVGIIFFILFYRIVHKYYSALFPLFCVWSVAIAVFISLDHFLFTTQQGQLVLAFACSFLIKKRKNI
jgi:hypothetical protein